ncbi:ShlB/FhaC/HecB family hemolysin secretion/activation protein [Elioraea sp.]|uniref:ShlB/FhaC/HecB family hemolysin secretion/activation protein n=1 Tax=Elioraea sp. TaxID=2185103 RepID=UPI003F7044CE
MAPPGAASGQPAAPPVLAPPAERVTVPPPPRPEPGVPVPAAPAVVPAPPGAETVRFTPRAIVVDGATAILPDRIEAETARLVGREVTVAEIFALAQRLERLYLDAGYFLSRVVVPPQRVEDGVVRLRVIEGGIAEIEFEGDIGPAIAQVRAFAAPILAERPLSVATLERALLLANDIPGVTAAATLRPGTVEGAPQMVISLTRKPYDGVVVYDNRQSRLQGPTQLFALGALNSFTRFGERSELLIVSTALRGQPEQRREQNFVQVNLSGFIGGSGLSVRAFAGGGRTEPGTPLAEIGYRGNVFVGGIGLSYPLIRSRATTLTITGQADIYQADSQEEAQRALQQRTEARYRTVRIGAEASFRDEWLGITGVRATFHRGIDGFRATPSDVTALAPRPGAEAGFIKWTAEVSRLQALFSAGRWAFDVLGVIAGQYTDHLLPQQEKFFLGGDRLGRGFFAGEVTGDRAVIGSIELRATSELRLTEADAEGLPTQFYGFVDLGRAWDRAAPGLPEPAAIPMRSLGLGVRMDIRSWLTLELEGVRRLTREFAGANVQPLSLYAGFFRLTGRF